jgi:arylsulfatase A-like enzyme
VRSAWFWGCFAFVLAAEAAAAPPAGSLDRSVLPIAEPNPAPIEVLDARDAKAPPRFEVKAPEGAPNVIIFLIDDMGFGVASAFGGPVPMPTLDALAAAGLRYNRFHTTALCSPTRTALLTGRNHHQNNAGAVMEIATAFPGNTGVRPQSITPLAEILRQNGYSTGAFGKYHETPPWEISVSGPFDRWPTRSGFDKFYGFIGGETNQWAPLIYDGMTKVELPHDPNYHFTVDMTNQAIGWMRATRALTPQKPFFLYYAPGATHAPHHVPKEWIEKFKGKFDQGWDAVREETLARQKSLGVVPPDTKLAPKPAAIQDWDKLSADEKKLFAHQMEVFAAFGAQTDSEIGRVVQALKDLGQYDNTLIFYIVGDNGTSAEGGMAGLFNELTYFNGVPETVQEQLQHLEHWGDPTTYPHMAAGWAIAGDTPFTWAKQVASNFGGTRNPLVISWPARIKSAGLRSQFGHVVDVAPTVLEAARLPAPKRVNGVAQTPMAGTSLVYSFDAPNAPERHTTQYFEIGGNRAIYYEGWVAGTVHKAPWEAAPRAPLAKDTWELYDTRSDFSESTDLAAKNVPKLMELQHRFLEEAKKYHVLPIDDRTIERFDAAIAGRPDLMAGRTSLTLYSGMTGIMENAFINVKNRSSSITAEVEVPEGGANGVILCQAGRFGGWSLYLHGGKPAFTYNYLGLDQYTVQGSQAVPPGKATIRWDFAYDGGGRGKGGTGTLAVNGNKVGEGRIEKTQANAFSADEGADVGLDEGTPVTEVYGPEPANHFTGTIERVTVEVK